PSRPIPRVVGEEKIVTAGAGFSVFAKPEQDALIVKRVNAGETFTLLSGEGSLNWTKIRLGAVEGWVLTQDMSVVTPVDVAVGHGFRGPNWQLFFTAPQPHDGSPNEYGINARFAHAVGQCKSSLDIAIYELDDPVVTAAILDAHSRGAKVRIVTDERS